MGWIGCPTIAAVLGRPRTGAARFPSRSGVSHDSACSSAARAVVVPTVPDDSVVIPFVSVARLNAQTRARVAPGGLEGRSREAARLRGARAALAARQDRAARLRVQATAAARA